MTSRRPNEVHKAPLGQPTIQRQLFARRPELLYRCTPRGNLLGQNEPGEPDNSSAPPFYICYRTGTYLYRLKESLPKRRKDRLAFMISRLPTPKSNHDQRFEEMVLEIASAAGADAKIEFGPAYYVPVLHQRPTTVVQLEDQGTCRLRGRFSCLRGKLALVQPCMAQLVNQQVASVCRTVRRSSTVSEAGVETMPRYRGRGYGRETVAAWAGRVWQDGQIPCYSTTWKNKASLSIARKLGMIQFATETEYAERV